MKNVKFLLPAILLLITMTAAAQKTIDVTERNVPMSLGTRNGYSIKFEGMSKKELQSRFTEFAQQFGKKIKLVEVTKTEYKLDDVVVNTLSANPVDIYLLFEEGKNETMVTGFFDVDGQFISSVIQPVKYKDAENFMRRFAWRIEKVKIEGTVSEAEKTLSKRQDEQKELEKKNASLNDNIKECNAAIEKANADLQQNAKDQELKKKEIADQQKAVDDVKAELKKYEGY